MKRVSSIGCLARILPTIVFFCAGFAFYSSLEAATGTPPQKYTQIGVIWNSRVATTYATDYLSSVAVRHKIDHPIINRQSADHIAAIKEDLSLFAHAKQSPHSSGYIYYLVANPFPLPPGITAVRFYTVADQAEFEKLVHLAKNMQPKATIEGAGDRFTLNVLVDKAMFPTYFRLHKGVLFEAQNHDLYTMDFPDASLLASPRTDPSRDMIARFDFDKVPLGLKEMALQIVKLKAQQRSPGENDAIFDFRQAVADYGLHVAKTVVDGARKAEFSLSLLQESQPGDFQMNLEIDEDSQLADSIARMTTANRRLGIPEDGALFTVALVAEPSDQLSNVFSRASNLLRFSFHGNTSAAQIADLLEIFAHQKSPFEGYMRLGIDPSGELVLYGALTNSQDQQLNGGALVTVDIPFSFFNPLKLPTSVNELLPSKLNLQTAGSTVWFSLGHNQSAKKLNDALFARNGAKPLSRTQFLTASLQPENWVSDPGAKRQAISALEKAFAGVSTNSEIRSFLDETISKNGFGGLEIHAKEGGSKSVHLKASIGDGLGRFVAARYLQPEAIQLEEKIAPYVAKSESPRQARRFSLNLVVVNLAALFLVVLMLWWRRKRMCSA